jgi:uncharacterized protein (DUF2236 family)
MPSSGYFSDSSLLRQVVGHRLTALSGPRALLMMAAHPVAFEGFFAHTGALDDPYARLARTGRVMDAIAFGTRAEADRMTRRVRAKHRRVRGELTERAGRYPAGTPYRADDPELLLWILAALADSAMLVYSKYVRRLDADARDALWQDYRVVGAQFGVAPTETPATAEAFDAYMLGMLAGDDLFVSGRARELAIDIVLHPPVTLHLRPLVELVNQRSPSAYCRRRFAACTGAHGIPCGRSRCTAAPSMSSACLSRCFQSGSPVCSRREPPDAPARPERSRTRRSGLGGGEVRGCGTVAAPRVAPPALPPSMRLGPAAAVGGMDRRTARSPGSTRRLTDLAAPQLLPRCSRGAPEAEPHHDAGGDSSLPGGRSPTL